MTTSPQAITPAWLDRARELAASAHPAWAERGREILRGEL